MLSIGSLLELKCEENNLFYRAPDDSPIKQKMIYASSKDALVKELQSGITKIQASDDGDLDKKDIQTKLINADRYE